LRFSFKLFLVVLVIGLVFAIVGISTGSPPIAVGVVTGLCAAVVALVCSFKVRSSIRKDLENRTKENRPFK
jgi:uncharacterized membrane protein required for colicin V production